MNKHIIFFIHGMGEHDQTWHEDSLAQLKASFRDYEFLRPLEFDTTFECLPLVYSDILTNTRARANEDFNGFMAAVLGSIDTADTSRDSIENELNKAGDLIGAGDDNFIWTHILDVILYRFSTTLRMGIDVSIAKQLTDALTNTPHTSWSIVAHSLGSTVIHNTLNSLYNTGFPHAPSGPIAALNPVETRCSTLAMIANVSRVLQRKDAKVFETNVKPGFAAVGSLCSFYLNVRHKLDPFTKPKPFDPGIWPDAATFSTERYQHIDPSHIHFESDELPNVHDLTHYVINPRVHVPFFRSILGRHIVPAEEYRQAKSRFDSEVKSNSADKARSLLESRLSGSNGNWRSLIAAIKRLHK